MNIDSGAIAAAIGVGGLVVVAVLVSVLNGLLNKLDLTPILLHFLDRRGKQVERLRTIALDEALPRNMRDAIQERLERRIFRE